MTPREREWLMQLVGVVLLLILGFLVGWHVTGWILEHQGGLV